MDHRIAIAFAMLLAIGGPASAEKKYGPGVTDTEIKLGQTFAYSGPASAYSVIPATQIAYFKMINAKGGINGRKISLISLDDGYSPPKTVEQTRKLVEQDEVSAIFSPLGAPTGLAVRKYLNAKKIPQLFVGSGLTLWGDFTSAPYSMGFQPSYQSETAVYGKYVVRNKPNAKIAIFTQNDDAGRDYASGFKKALGAMTSQIVSEATYEPSDASIDSQIVKLAASGADVLFMHAIPKQASQAIKKIYEIGWKPTFFLAATSTSVSSVLKPAGLEASTGIISAYFLKDPTDLQWAKDKGYLEWLDFMNTSYPDGNKSDQLVVYGYTVAQAMVEVLKQCGDEITPENIMRQATHLDIDLPMLLPGSRLQTSPTDYYPIKGQRLQRFNGKVWELFGDATSD